MLIIFYLIVFCSNFFFIKCEDNGNMIIDVKPGVNCTTNLREYTFTAGSEITLMVNANFTINHGWWRLNNSTGFTNFYYNLNTTKEITKGGTKEPIVHTHLVDQSMAGAWQFTFYYYRDISYNKESLLVHYDGHNFTEAICSTTVRVVCPNPPNSIKLLIILTSVFGVIGLVVIISQAAYIVLLKAKARKLITLNRHNNLSNLSKKAEPNDTARYCSNPGQKIMRAPPVDNENRDSVIYEAPNIEMPDGIVRMPTHPPQPPAITTMPRTPRPDQNIKSGRNAVLAWTLNSLGRSPKPDRRPRENTNEREPSVATRPPLPLPPQDLQQNTMHHEVYEEMEPEEENTYEPPPIINTLPGRLPMPPKKVPTGNLLNVNDNTQKPKTLNKPVVTPKPQRSANSAMSPANELKQAFRRRNETVPNSHTGNIMQTDQNIRRRPIADSQTKELDKALRRRNNANAQAPANELEDAFKRRNNAMPVHIKSIPDPSSTATPNSRPPPAIKKPKMPPPVQEEIYYNENQASSDEEWTYEPLKPLTSYDPNLYNI